MTHLPNPLRHTPLVGRQTARQYAAANGRAAGEKTPAAANAPAPTNANAPAPRPSAEPGPNGPAAQNPAATPPQEILLGRYRVLQRRGTGGFGVVCTCWDTRLQRRVAIKRLPIVDGSTQATTTAAEALAEARTSCMLAHPNIVTVYDFETDGTYAYLVMEYVDGLNLAELLARVEDGRLTPPECAHILQSITGALAFAHENRVLHLDIKPTNIMIDRQGTVKLADFGMSTLASAAGYGGARGGTVGYMPPEQIEGMIVDERADVFSLAVVVWQALTGADPFLAPTPAASAELIRRGPARAISRDYPELAGIPEQALANALAPSPAERPAQVEHLAADLVPWMGSPQDGAASLKDLVNQAEKDEDPEPDAWEVRHLPWHLRAPWLEPACERALAALATFAVLHQTLPAFAGATGQFVAMAALICTAVTAAWPPLGSVLAAASAAVPLATTTPTAASFPLAAVTMAATVAWWTYAGRSEHLAAPALLLGACQPSPFAGAQVAGFGLDPLPAAATSAAGYFFAALFAAATNAGFAALPAAAQLGAALATPGFWAGAAAAVTCGALSSAIALRGTVAAQLAGTAAGGIVAAAAAIACAGMENGGIWAAPAWELVALAILWSVFLCIAAVLRGPLFEDQEGEDIDELSE